MFLQQAGCCPWAVLPGPHHRVALIAVSSSLRPASATQSLWSHHHPLCPPWLGRVPVLTLWASAFSFFEASKIFTLSFQADVSKSPFYYSFCSYICLFLFLFLYFLPWVEAILIFIRFWLKTFPFLLVRLSQPLDWDLTMNSSFWSFNLQTPLFWGTTLLTCHPATHLLTSSQLPSLAPLLLQPSADLSYMDRHNFSVSSETSPLLLPSCCPVCFWLHTVNCIQLSWQKCGSSNMKFSTKWKIYLKAGWTVWHFTHPDVLTVNVLFLNKHGHHVLFKVLALISLNLSPLEKSFTCCVFHKYIFTWLGLFPVLSSPFWQTACLASLRRVLMNWKHKKGVHKCKNR